MTYVIKMILEFYLHRGKHVNALNNLEWNAETSRAVIYANESFYVVQLFFPFEISIPFLMCYCVIQVYDLFF